MRDETQGAPLSERVAPPVAEVRIRPPWSGETAVRPREPLLRLAAKLQPGLCGARLLVGDVGGVKTLLEIVDIGECHIEVLHRAGYRTREHPSLVAVVKEFLAGAGASARTVERGCFAVTGVVAGNKAVASRVCDWLGDADVVARDAGLKSVRFINDLQALAYGVEALGATGWRYLQGERLEARRTRVVIGVGSGLGQSILAHSCGHTTSLPSEAGQAPFAPIDPERIALWEFLRRRHGMVTWERVLSRQGLMELCRFLEQRRDAGCSDGLCPRIDGADRVAALVRHARSGCPCQASAAIDLFAELLGQYAANLAVATLAEGGVVLAGGVVWHLLPWLATPAFFRGLHQPGPLAPMLERVPVAVATNPSTSLVGAAIAAAQPP